MTLKQFTQEYEILLKTNPSKCRQYVNKIYHSVKDEQNSFRLGVLYRKAYLHYLEGEFSKASEELEEVIIEGTSFPFFPEYAYAFNLTGIINMLRGNPIEAKVFYRQAMFYAKKHRMKSYKAFIYSNMAVVEAYLKQYESCIEDLLLAIQVSSETDGLHLESYYYNLSRNYIQLGKAKEAKEALDNCRRYHTTECPDVYFLFLQKGIAELNKEEDKVKEYIHQIYEYYENKSLTELDTDACFTLCNDFYQYKEFEHVRSIIGKLQEFSEQSNRIDIDLYVYEMLSKLAIEQHDVIKANEYLNKLISLYQEMREKDERVIEERINTRLKVVELKKIVESKIQENQYLQKESMTDALTKLENRRAFISYVKTLRKEKEIGCLVIDVDNFKLFNDKYGHNVGDYVLSNVGEILSFYNQDRIKAFRYGGDEFVVISHGISKEELLSLAEQIKNRVNEIKIPNIKVMVSVTVGVCHQYEADDIEEIITTADEALRKGKKKKNTIVELK